MGVTVVDSSVLIAALDADDAHHPAARLVLADAWEAGDRIVVPVVAYAETMVRPLSTGGTALARAERFFQALPIEPLGAAAGRAAADLRARHRGLRLAGALILATASALGATRVITADAGWARIDGRVEVVGVG